jgi:DNA polymerase-3 subunit delta
MAPWQVDKARRQLRGWSEAGLARAGGGGGGGGPCGQGRLPSKAPRAGDPVFAVEHALLEIGAAWRGASSTLRA